MSAREEVLAALAAMQARLDAATPGSLAVPSSPQNAALIVSVVNREQRVIDHVTDVLARHIEWPNVEIEHQEECDNCASLYSVKPCTITACQGCYSVSDDGMTVGYVEYKDCPEVASVHAMVVGP